MISVVISVLNDARGLKRTLTSLVAEKTGHEVWVADAGSIDGSVAIAREMKWAKRVRCSGSRAARMNQAAARARGDILLFMEAGVILERGWAAAAEQAAAAPGFAYGCFRLEISGCHPGLRIAEHASRFRTRLLRIGRTNQALFVKTADVRGADVFLDAGTLEGADLSRRMRQRGRMSFLSLRAVAPADRWREAGVATRVLRDALTLHRWYHGEQPSALAPLGGDQRNAVLIFCEAPEPGKVMRWLGKRIGDDRAVRAYQAGIRQAFATVRRSRIDSVNYLFFRPKHARRDVERSLGGAAILVDQTGKTETERRAHAILTAHAWSPGKMLILSPHCPALTVRELRGALRALDRHDIVLGPTHTGGWYLVGIQSPQPAFLAQLKWNSDVLLSDATAAASQAGLSQATLRSLEDFSREEDVNRNWALGYLQA